MRWAMMISVLVSGSRKSCSSRNGSAADTGIKTIHDLAKHKGKLRIAAGYKASKIIPYYIAGILANAIIRPHARNCPRFVEL